VCSRTGSEIYVCNVDTWHPIFSNCTRPRIFDMKFIGSKQRSATLRACVRRGYNLGPYR
jgi:hypothetical protein